MRLVFIREMLALPKPSSVFGAGATAGVTGATGPAQAVPPASPTGSQHLTVPAGQGGRWSPVAPWLVGNGPDVAPLVSRALRATLSCSHGRQPAGHLPAQRPLTGPLP